MKRSYLITAGAALFAALLIAFFRGFSPGNVACEAFAGLCDGFFAVGAVLVCAGIFSWIGRSGFYDIFSYGARTAWNRLTPFIKREETPSTYYDYKVRKEEKRKPVMKVSLVLGLVFLLLSVVFLIAYNMTAA